MKPQGIGYGVIRSWDMKEYQLRNHITRPDMDTTSTKQTPKHG